MRFPQSLAGGSVAVLLLAFAAPAEQPEAVPSRQVTYEQLVELGDAIDRLRDVGDNHYLLEEESARLVALGQSYVGGEIEYLLDVQRVRPGEVIAEMEPAGQTSVLLRHAEPPHFGNVHTVWYHGPVSTERYNLFALPLGLRVGSEIPLEMASKLRRHDKLLIKGRVHSLPVYVKSVFNPMAVVVISDWQVVEVNPEARE